MTTTTFDTLKFANRLKTAGVPDKQAEALAEAQADMMSESLASSLATKMDIAEVKTELLVIQWMLGLVIAAEVLPLLKAVLA